MVYEKVRIYSACRLDFKSRKMMLSVFLFAPFVSLSTHVNYFLPTYHCQHFIHLRKVTNTKEKNSS